MDRDHSHRSIGPVAVGLVLLRHQPLLRQPQSPQPVGRGRGTQLLAMETLLHQLGHLLQVRQQPPAPGQARQGVSAEPIGKHPQQAPTRQLAGQAIELARQGAPGG